MKPEEKHIRSVCPDSLVLFFLGIDVMNEALDSTLFINYHQIIAVLQLLKILKIVIYK